MSPRRLLRQLVRELTLALASGDTAPPEAEALRVARLVLARYGLSRRLSEAIVGEAVRTLALTATPAAAAAAARAASALAPELGRLAGRVELTTVQALRRLYRRGELLRTGDVEAALRRASRLSESQAAAVAQTATAALDRAQTMATDDGRTRYRYAGPAAERAFCQAMLARTAAGETWTLAEIRQMSNGTGLPVEFTCGGYRCRHRWVVAVDVYNEGRTTALPRVDAARVAPTYTNLQRHYEAAGKAFPWAEYERDPVTSLYRHPRAPLPGRRDLWVFEQLARQGRAVVVLPENFSGQPEKVKPADGEVDGLPVQLKIRTPEAGSSKASRTEALVTRIRRGRRNAPSVIVVLWDADEVDMERVETQALRFMQEDARLQHVLVLRRIGDTLVTLYEHRRP